MSGLGTEEYVFFNGQRAARRDITGSVVHYYFADHLGSADVVTSNTGAIQKEVDYFPYGGEITVTGSDANIYKFTGKERDAESGLDEFGARYYGSSLGRFMTPDWAAKPTAVPYAHFGNPQSLNLYSYVQNNPTTVGDPDGHCTDPLSCGVEFAGIGTIIEPGGGTVIGAALGGIVGGAILYFGGKAIVNSIHHSDDSANKNAPPPPANLPSKSQGAQSTPADPNRPNDKNGKKDENGQSNKADKQSEPGTKKDTSLQGRQDQLEDIERAQQNQDKTGKPIDSIEKSKQNLDKALKDIKTLEDAEPK